MTDVSKVVHEGGLTATSTSGSKEISQKHKLRPILVVQVRPTATLDYLVGRDGAMLGAPSAAFYHNFTGDLPLHFKKLALSYDIGASLHHCVCLAKAYESIVVDFQRIRSIPGFGAASESSTFAYRGEPYYEFDALLSAIRRAYDKLGHYVWHAFEGRGGGRPDDMGKILPRLHRCPRPLADRLRDSWGRVGKRLKHYRDCTQHFASADDGFCSVTMIRVGDGVYRTRAPIPDNPEVHARKKFTYLAGLDALTYGWEATEEIVALARAVLAAAIRSADVDDGAGNGGRIGR